MAGSPSLGPHHSGQGSACSAWSPPASTDGSGALCLPVSASRDHEAGAASPPCLQHRQQAQSLRAGQVNEATFKKHNEQVSDIPDEATKGGILVRVH